MKEEPSYFAIIPANVRYDEDLPPNAKLLYGEITALCNKHGYCWATNNYFADLYKVSKNTVSRWVNMLIKKGYLESETTTKKHSKEIDKRFLRIGHPPIKNDDTPPLKNATPPIKNDDTPHTKKRKGNKTVINNTFNSSINPDGLTGELSFISQETGNKETPPVAATPPKSTYQHLVDIHWEWFKDRNDGVPPKMDGVEGKATKQLVAYFETVARSKAGDEVLLPQEVQTSVCNMFSYILNKWPSLEPFLQKQTKLSQINSNITNIINYIKNGSKTQSAHQRKQDRESVINEGISAIRNHFAQQK